MPNFATKSLPFAFAAAIAPNQGHADAPSAFGSTGANTIKIVVVGAL